MKQIIVLLLSAIVGVAIMSCKESGTNPPEEKPPGYQEDIPWPSLADSPWPMGHHDPQSTGRSRFLGPKNGHIRWSANTHYNQAGISIGDDSVIYFCQTGYLKRINNVGSQVDSLFLSDKQIFSTPLIDKFGNIFVTSTKDSTDLYCVSSGFTIKWKVTVHGAMLGSMLNIDRKGNLYFIANNSLYSVSPGGTIQWLLTDPNIFSGVNGISFSSDGATLYLPGYNCSLIAVDIASNSIRWKFGTITNYNAPVVSSNGKIFILPKEVSITEKSTLFCLNENGSTLWKYEYHSTNIYFTGKPTLDKFGRIYFASDSLYCLDHNGVLNWKIGLSGSCEAPLVVDILSNVYVSTQLTQGATNIVSLSMYNSEGTKKWSIDFESVHTGNCPALSSDNIYFSNWRSFKVYAIN